MLTVFFGQIVQGRQQAWAAIGLHHIGLYGSHWGLVCLPKSFSKFRGYPVARFAFPFLQRHPHEIGIIPICYLRKLGMFLKVVFAGLFFLGGFFWVGWFIGGVICCGCYGMTVMFGRFFWECFCGSQVGKIPIK